MSVEIKGQKELIDKLEKKFGKQNMQRISDSALKAGSEVFVKELESEIRTFSRVGASPYAKGYTYEEITTSEPMWDNGERVIKVYWSGPHNRQNIVHLNEWGTVRNPSPPGKGRIAAALKKSEKAYHDSIKRALEAGL